MHKTKLLVTVSALPKQQLASLMGPEWAVHKPGDSLAGRRFDLILVPLEHPYNSTQEQYETWIHEVVRCRLSSPDAKLIRI